MLDKVRNTIKKYALLKKGERVLVAVSGGPDSVALLYVLNALRQELKLSLHVAHLDHMLRPEAQKDREFTEGLAKRLGLPSTCIRLNIKRLAKYGSLEEIARNARLGFLFQVAKKIKADRIALGHNLDDQAETVLMRILRGTGLYGLSAILPKRKICGYQIIRPLIEVRRREIETFLRKRKISPCRDMSNLQDAYYRNKIRNKLLPLLEKEYNSNIKEVLSNLAESCGYDYDYLKRAAAKSMTSLGKNINLHKFAKLHPAIQRLVLRYRIASLKGDLRRLTLKHIKEIQDLILNRPVNSIVDLPKDISIVKKKKKLHFYLRQRPPLR